MKNKTHAITLAILLAIATLLPFAAYSTNHTATAEGAIATKTTPAFRSSESIMDAVKRRDALSKIDDQAILVQIAKNDESDFVRGGALEKINDQSIIEELAKNDKSVLMRLSAIGRLENQALLAEIARNDDDFGMRRAAVARLSDQTLIAEIARNDANDNVRMAAVEVLNDSAVLAEIAKTDSGKSGVKYRLRLAAAKRYNLLRPDDSKHPPLINPSPPTWMNNMNHWMSEVMPTWQASLTNSVAAVPKSRLKTDSAEAAEYARIVLENRKLDREIYGPTVDVYDESAIVAFRVKSDRPFPAPGRYNSMYVIDIETKTIVSRYVW